MHPEYLHLIQYNYSIQLLDHERLLLESLGWNPVISQKINSVFGIFHNCILHLFMVPLPENLSPKFLCELTCLPYMDRFQLKA